MTGPSTRATPYPKMTDAVGNTATAIRAVAEAVPPAPVLPAGYTKVALQSRTITTTVAGGVTWTETFTGFSEVQGYLAVLRRCTVTASGGAFNNRAAYPYPTYPAGVNILPLTGSELTINFAMASHGFDLPAATYVIDYLIWGR
jgi:hypothetical protein